LEGLTSTKPCTETVFATCEKLSAINALIFGNLETGFSTMTMHLLKNFLIYTCPIKNYITELSQPSFSPGLGPAKYYLLPRMKSLDGCRFQSAEEVKRGYDNTYEGCWKRDCSIVFIYYKIALLFNLCILYDMKCTAD
jgi:hypothetical protein